MQKPLRASRAFSAFAALAAIAAFPGCGGGGSAGPPASSRMFVPNYAGETDPQTNQPNRLYHWAALPVRIYIDPAESSLEMRDSARQGFDWWTRSAGRLGDYVLVADSKLAEVIVRFEAAGTNGYSGQTRYSYVNDQTLVGAEISLNLTYLGDPGNVPPAAAHELGHALGIGGHSNDNGDLMCFSPAIFRLSSPSLRDVNTLKTGYWDLASRAPAGRDAGEIHTETVRCAFPSSDQE